MGIARSLLRLSSIAQFQGQPAEAARLFLPNSVAVDRTGNVYISDDQNSRIRQVSGNGIITTIAGDGIYDYADPSTVPAVKTAACRAPSIALKVILLTVLECGTWQSLHTALFPWLPRDQVA